MLGAANSAEYPETHRTAIWDPNDNTWIEAGLEFGVLNSTDKTDPFSEESWALLPDGSVLAPAVVNTPQAQRYLPALDEWVNCGNSPVNLASTMLNGITVNETGPAIVLPGGSTFAIGGTGQTAIFTLGPTATDPGSWTTGPAFPADTTAAPNWPTLTALDAPAALLPSGKVVLLAGSAEPTDGDYFSSYPVALEYDPSSTATTLPPLDNQPNLPTGNQTWQSAFMVLPTGQLLCSAQTNTIFIYTPDPSETPDPAWKPANITVPSTMVLNHSYTLSGTQINGLSQAVSYGDDAGMATNYPIVRLTNPATGQVVYARSYDFNTMGIATGTAVPDDLQSCTIDIPGTLATGTWNLAVIANGIASQPGPGPDRRPGLLLHRRQQHLQHRRDRHLRGRRPTGTSHLRPRVLCGGRGLQRAGDRFWHQPSDPAERPVPLHGTPGNRLHRYGDPGGIPRFLPPHRSGSRSRSP